MTLKSKYNGSCAVCGKSYKVDDMIEWMSRGKARHIDCLPKQPVQLRDVLTACFEAMRGSASVDEAVDIATKTLDNAFATLDVTL